MKQIFALLRNWQIGVLLGILASLEANAQSWQTVVGVTQAGISSIRATAVDPGGNVYVAGHFSNTARFGNATLTSAGGTDVFVAKWNNSGSLVWVQQAGGTDDEQVTSLVVRGTSLYVAGYSSTTASFGTFTLTSAGGKDGFLTKLTDYGATASYDWAQRVGGANDDLIFAIAVSGNNVFATGRISGTVSYGASPPSSGGNNAFIAKFVDAGSNATVSWAQRTHNATTNGPANYSVGTSIAVSGTNIYVVGNASSDTFALNGTRLGGGPLSFLLKLTDAGLTSSLVWSQVMGISSYRDHINFQQVAVTGSNIYVGGDNGMQSGSNSNSSQGLLLKYADAGSGGSLVWRENFPQIEGPPPVYAIAVNGTHVYIAGTFRTIMGVGNTSIMVNYPLSGAWVARFEDLGSTSGFLWVQQAGMPSSASYSQCCDAQVVSLALGSGGTLYVGGNAYPAAVFGSLSLGPAATGFLATIQDATVLATAPAFSLDGLRIHPNPAHGTATIQLPAIPGTATAILTLLDALGRTLRTQTVSTNARAELDLTGLAPGLYAVRVQAGVATAMRRLVVE